ncbi:hydantoinase B/oxoprolinase family protein [Ancylobacter sp. G4_0304]|uniref:hydantoinase B/oxoprolinase family protein n=1 Tax=Ancylobacter sp. G4_0304 TaxID=3114289 RepID=UPI0039C75A8D
MFNDSEAAGEHRGAPGTKTASRPIHCDFELAFSSGGTVDPSLSHRGGGDGAPALHYFESHDGKMTELSTSEHVLVRRGQRVMGLTNGGGGHGPASAHDPTRVAADIAENGISRKRARDVYRGALSDAKGMEEAATAALREAVT